MNDEWKVNGNWIIADRPECVCALEEYRRGDDQMVFIHLNVRKWSLETLRLLRKGFATLRQFVTCPLYACGDETDEKWARFVSMFGFKPLLNAGCTDGKSRRIYVQFKDQEQKNVQPSNYNFSKLYQ